MTHSVKDTWQASDSLQAWFQSQELKPAEAVMVAEMFIARLIAINSTSIYNMEDKFSLTNRTIRDFAEFALIQKETQ